MQVYDNTDVHHLSAYVYIADICAIADTSAKPLISVLADNRLIWRKSAVANFALLLVMNYRAIHKTAVDPQQFN